MISRICNAGDGYGRGEGQIESDMPCICVAAGPEGNIDRICKRIACTSVGPYAAEINLKEALLALCSRSRAQAGEETKQHGKEDLHSGPVLSFQIER
jgi:hypothetical protein